jgi:regulator of RNase E activity RraA
MTPLTSQQLAALAKVDSPTVANVIELFDLGSYLDGFTDHRLKAIYPELPPAAGYAVTATFRASKPTEAEDAYGGMPQLIAESLSIPEPRIVVFEDLDGTPQAATYGEVMVSSFQGFGFVGLMTSGAARDIEQVRQLNFPCWASSTIVSHGYCRILKSGVPVTIAGLEVQPRDILHADVNGVIKIPHRIAPAVAELCGPFMQAEQIIIDYVRSPNPSAAGYKEAVSKAKSAMAELRARARGFLKNNPS